MEGHNRKEGELMVAGKGSEGKPSSSAGIKKTGLLSSAGNGQREISYSAGHGMRESSRSDENGQRVCPPPTGDGQRGVAISTGNERRGNASTDGNGEEGGSREAGVGQQGCSAMAADGQRGFSSSIGNGQRGENLEFEEEVSLFNLDSVPGPEEEHEKTTPTWMLGATVLTSRKFNVDAMISTLIRVWRPFRGAQGRVVGDNLFVFVFQHERDMTRVLEGGPWHFDNQLIVLKRVESLAEVSVNSMSRCEFWVRIMGLSPYRISKAQACGIGRTLGEFVDYDGDIGKPLSAEYIRVRIALDITKPIRRGMLLVMKGVPKWFDFRYERLPNYCFWCGGFDHVERECVAAFEENAKEGDVRKFAGLRAVEARPLFMKVANSSRWLNREGQGFVGPRFVHRRVGTRDDDLREEGEQGGNEKGLEDVLTNLSIRAGEANKGKDIESGLCREEGKELNKVTMERSEEAAIDEGVGLGIHGTKGAMGEVRGKVVAEQNMAEIISVELGSGNGNKKCMGQVSGNIVLDGGVVHGVCCEETEELGARLWDKGGRCAALNMGHGGQMSIVGNGINTKQFAAGTWKRRSRAREESVSGVERSGPGCKRNLEDYMEVEDVESVNKLQRVDAVILANPAANPDVQGCRAQ